MHLYFSPLRIGFSFIAICSILLIQCGAQTQFRSNQINSYNKLSDSAQNFGFEAFSHVAASFSNKDFMISPFSIWALWVLLLEGSSGNTHNEIRKTLRIENDLQAVRQAFKIWQQHLNINTTTVEVATLQAIYQTNTIPAREEFKRIVEQYGATLNLENFGNRDTYKLINNDVESVTHGLIKSVVLPQDLADAKLVMISSLYFKGKWKYPFNKSLTKREIFYDENEQPIGEVEMMNQEEKFVFTGQIPQLNSYVLELPYGKENRLSMLIILPKRFVKIGKVADTLATMTLREILEKLDEAQEYSDNEVELTMPKFSTTTDMKLKPLLSFMGINDAFNSSAANLNNIGSDLYVQDCIHKATIIVDEEGTTATAATSAVLINKTGPTRFLMNKPFIYLIVERTTQLLLFAGQVVNPINSNA